jgi:hypothetical protein
MYLDNREYVFCNVLEQMLFDCDNVSIVDAPDLIYLHLLLLSKMYNARSIMTRLYNSLPAMPILLDINRIICIPPPRIQYIK